MWPAYFSAASGAFIFPILLFLSLAGKMGPKMCHNDTHKILNNRFCLILQALPGLSADCPAQQLLVVSMLLSHVSFLTTCHKVFSFCFWHFCQSLLTAHQCSLPWSTFNLSHLIRRLEYRNHSNYACISENLGFGPKIGFKVRALKPH